VLSSDYNHSTTQSVLPATASRVCSHSSNIGTATAINATAASHSSGVDSSAVAGHHFCHCCCAARGTHQQEGHQQAPVNRGGSRGWGEGEQGVNNVGQVGNHHNTDTKLALSDAAFSVCPDPLLPSPWATLSV